MVNFKYRNQKLNTKISTEADLVGVSDYLLYSIWIVLFMGLQGYEINQNIFFQDNQSKMKMKKTGRSHALGTLGTSIYITYLLMTRLKETTCQLHTASQSTCLQMF